MALSGCLGPHTYLLEVNCTAHTEYRGLPSPRDVRTCFPELLCQTCIDDRDIPRPLLSLVGWNLPSTVAALNVAGSTLRTAGSATASPLFGHLVHHLRDHNTPTATDIFNTSDRCDLEGVCSQPATAYCIGLIVVDAINQVLLE